jgi:hypothetical protein
MYIELTMHHDIAVVHKGGEGVIIQQTVKIINAMKVPA